MIDQEIKRLEERFGMIDQQIYEAWSLVNKVQMENA